MSWFSAPLVANVHEVCFAMVFLCDVFLYSRSWLFMFVFKMKTHLHAKKKGKTCVGCK